MGRFHKFVLTLLAPKFCQIGDVVLLRSGKAYWVQPGRLVEMRIVRFSQLNSTEDGK